MKNLSIKTLVYMAMLLSIGMILPFFTGQIPQIGSMLLPMHIPVFLCGLICGWAPGMLIGFVLPLLRSFVFGMPPLYPTAIAMAFELATYGAVAGLLYNGSRRQSLLKLYCSIVAAMLFGRLIWGASQVILLGIKGNSFTFSAFIGGAVLNAIPGIVLQLILIPAVMLALRRTVLTDRSVNYTSNDDKQEK